MGDQLGSLCIVLHGHLPYVLNHGVHPHGENWLYEAAAETYLPLLDVLDAVARPGRSTGLTVGLTPVLLEQLAHPRFKEGFVEYLQERIARAEADLAEFEADAKANLVELAERWVKWHGDRLAHFERIGRDIPAQFAARFRDGQIQILTSNATHYYMPLSLNDQMLTAQMKLGTETSRKHLGTKPTGMWLPECAYRPQWDQWVPAVLYDNPRLRVGLENFMAAAGVTHFFVESHMVAYGAVMGVFAGGKLQPKDDAAIYRETHRGWKEPLEPVGVVSWHRPPDVFAFARHPKVSEQVWSGSIGYPADGVYLDFHRKHGEHGLRYHKVTSTKTEQADKEPYAPADVAAKAKANARHFANVVRETLREYHGRTERRGTVTASFDAELFGHWWFEGPLFLREVLRLLADDPEVELQTAEQVLKERTPEKVMRLPEGSWGEGGDHRVWINAQNRWYWEIEYRAEGRFLKLLHALPWRENAEVRALLTRAARELLLLQASDWPFVIHSGGAVDYGNQRISLHALRFDRACQMAERVGEGKPLTELMRVQLAEIDAHDTIFDDLKLEWWL
jgi:1,4-alpha-glucan branching enzyme